MKRIASLWFSLLLLASSSLWAKPVALFYLGDEGRSIRDFKQHTKQIDVVVPTWYEVDQDGLVSGAPEPAVLQLAHQEHIQVMPILALFNKTQFHALATNPKAQDAMNDAMVRESKEHGYTGFQFDFENILWTDRDALSALVKKSADAMHAAGLQLSIATVPNGPGHPTGKGGFARWIYSDWRGGYDLEAIGKAVDLVCLMTYDQNTRWTTPGPVAGWQWVIENLDYALKVVPKEKLSLGIPAYSYIWHTGAPITDKASGEERPNPTADFITGADVRQLADDYNRKVQWDEEDRASYFWFARAQMREWVFFTDRRTFEERYKLTADRGLQGFCTWVLGDEDPEIWKFLPSR